MTLIDSLKWRYATKKFDKNRKISSSDLAQLRQAVSLAASSYGLQPYKVLVIENAAVRARLLEAAYGQPQITDASHLFLFCHYTDVSPEKTEAFIKLTSDVTGTPVSALKNYSDLINGTVAARSPEALQAWTSKQAYIGLGTLLAAAAEMRVDACPMEGFNPAAFNEILGLPAKGLSASVLAAVGYRSAEDPAQFRAKVRKPFDQMFEEIA